MRGSSLCQNTLKIPVCGVEKDKCEHVAEADWKTRPLELGRSRALVMLSTQIVTSPL